MKYLLRLTLSITFIILLVSEADAQERINIRTLIRYQLDYIDDVYIPRDIYDSFEQIDDFWSDSLRREVKIMSEDEFSTTAHFGFGLWMRNNWGLWGGSRLSKYFNDLGVFHPDDMSGIILDSYHRYLNGNDIKLDEQIAFYKQYWEKPPNDNNSPRITKDKYAKKIRKEIKEEMRPFKRGNIMYYDYPYEFSSETEENAYDNDSIALGKILDVDLDRKLIKVKLIKSYNPHGVILYDTHYDKMLYKDEIYDDNGKIIPQGDRKIFYMVEGDEFWFYYEDDYWEVEE